MTIIGTRPEIIRLSRIISNLEKNFNHVLVHTGQNYDFELNEIFFKDLKIKKPNYYLDSAGKTSSETIGKIIINIEPILLKEKPDAILILGDTNSCLTAIVAKRNKIPIFHMEAGNRCFDMNVPEEINRRIVDHIADINLTYSTIARNFLVREGIHPKFIIKTGSPMKEVIDHYLPKSKKSKILNNLSIKKNKYFVVSSHREENIDNQINFNNLTKSINEIAKRYRLPVIFSTHPRTKKKISDSKIVLHKNIRLIKPLNFTDYLKLQMNSKAVLSDSGTINEEASLLNLRAINLRESHERHEAMEEASTVMTGLKFDVINNALNLFEKNKFKSKVVYDYDVSNVSDKISKILLSYIHFINREIWKKK